MNKEYWFDPERGRGGRINLYDSEKLGDVTVLDECGDYSLSLTAGIIRQPPGIWQEGEPDHYYFCCHRCGNCSRPVTDVDVTTQQAADHLSTHMKEHHNG